MLIKDKRILLIGAHPDDLESGCGGTVAKYSKNNETYSLVIAPCLEDPLNAGILQEYQLAMKVLGVKRIPTPELPRDILEQHRQRIRDILHNLKMKLNPDIVFCPSLSDLHQDHRTVADCSLTIFRDSATLLAYEIVRSTHDFRPELYVVLSNKNMNKKLEVLQCYKTQSRRLYFKPYVFESLAVFRGSSVNAKYAEAFEIMRMIDK